MNISLVFPPVLAGGRFVKKREYRLSRKEKFNPQRRHVRREERIFSKESQRTEEKIATLQISRPKSL